MDTGVFADQHVLTCRACNVRNDEVMWMGKIQDDAITAMRLCVECVAAERKAGYVVLPINRDKCNREKLEAKILATMIL